MANQGPEHVQAAKSILKYLKGTKHLKLSYSRQPVLTGNTLAVYVDSDYAGNLDTCRSVTCIIVVPAVSGQSMLQQVNMLSSAEAE